MESVNPLDSPDKEFENGSIPGFDASNIIGEIENMVKLLKATNSTAEDTDILVSKLISMRKDV